MSTRSDPADGRGRQFDFARTVALSDGVFAIALTLLVISIAVPDLPSAREDELPGRLLALLPQIFSYGFSFAVIARLWVRHHHLFGDLVRIDGRLTALNMIYLALIAFIPFPTQLIGAYGDRSIAAAVYGLTIGLVAGVGALMRVHAHRAGLMRSDAERDPEPALGVASVFLISVPLAFLSPFAAEALWLVSTVLLRRSSGGGR